MRTLTQLERTSVNGGIWPVIVAGFAAGYVYGKDRAERDNKREESSKNSACSP